MHAKEHSTVREGLITGVLGAAVVALWYLVFDLAQGRPFRTPNALGRLFFAGGGSPATGTIDFGVVAGYTVVHLALFVLAGIGLAYLAHLASRNPGLRMGVWIGLVVAYCLLTGLVYMLAVATEEPLPLWEVIGGGLIGIGSMAWVLWKWHPRLGRPAQPVSWGEEAEAPPHPPGGPGV